MSGRTVRTALVGLVLLTTIPAFALIVYMHDQMRRDAMTDAQDAALRLARVATLEQENAIREMRHSLMVLAASRQVLGGDTAGCSAYFAEVLKALPRYANFGVIEPDGELSCSGAPVAGRVSLADRKYFRRALEAGRFAIGDYEIDRVTGRGTLNFGYPVRDGAGKIRSVVFAALDVRWLSHLAARSRLPPGSAVTVLDVNGLVLARDPEPDRWVGKAVVDAPIVRTVRMLRGEATGEDGGLDGVVRVYAFAPLPRSEDGGNVFIAVGVPREVVLAGVNRALVRNLTGAAVATCLALALVWVASGRMLVRLERSPPPFVAEPRRRPGTAFETTVRAYGVVLALVGVALGVEIVIWPTVQPSVSPPFFAAVMLSAWYGGLGPGLVATVLSSVASAFFFMPPIYSIEIGWDDFVRLLAFAGVAVLTSVLNARRRRAEEELRRRADHQTRIVELSRHAITDGDFKTVIREAVAVTAGGLAVECVGIFEALPDRRGLVLRAGTGWREGSVGQAVLLLGDDSLAAYTLRSVEPVIVDVGAGGRRFQPAPLLLEHNIAAGLTVAIRGSARDFGILGAFVAGPRAFDKGDVQFVQGVAHVLGLVVRRNQVWGTSV